MELRPDALCIARSRSVRCCRALWLVLGLVFGVSAAFAQNAASIDASAKGAVAGEVQFDIPSRPLADALVAYGKAAGLEVFYDGALAIGRRSTEVKGTFSPSYALHQLLRGTGYVPKATDHPDTMTIVSAPRTAPPIATFNRYESFFSVLQARLSEALCKNDEASPDSEEVIFKVWLDPAGSVSRAEVLGTPASNVARVTLASGLRGLRVGRAPPPGMPQPVTMVIYPPAIGEATGCPVNDGRRSGH